MRNIEQQMVLALRAVQLGIDPSEDHLPEKILEALQAHWDSDGHPVTPWFALRFAKDHGLQQPEWVIDYFYDRGGVINELAHQKSGRPQGELVGLALGFGAEGRGKSSPMAQAVAQSRDWHLAFKAKLKIAVGFEQGAPLKLEAVVHEVAGEEGVSRTAVFEALAKWGARVELQLKEIAKTNGVAEIRFS